LIYELDLYILQMYQQTDKECSRSRHSKFKARTAHTEMLFLLLWPWPWTTCIPWSYTHRPKQRTFMCQGFRKLY